ncbi:MAG: hypothetical protein LBG68_04315 [Coriobacteriales bacterium]|jgi:hypothetical protein|nr:hypothetical protein [Coriobacteriales bacterium]
MSTVAGTWTIKIKTPMGEMVGVWVFEENADGTWGGTNSAMGNTSPWDSLAVEGNQFQAQYTMESPMGKMSGGVQGVYDADSDTISGVNISSMGNADFTGARS